MAPWLSFIHGTATGRTRSSHENFTFSDHTVPPPRPRWSGWTIRHPAPAGRVSRPADDAPSFGPRRQHARIRSRKPPGPAVRVILPCPAGRYDARVTNPPPPEDYRLLHAAAYLALFCVGVYAATFGPALPFIASDLNISLDTAGLILTALFVGSISASAAVATVLHGRDTRKLCLAGLACATAGLLLIGIAPDWQVAFLGGVVLGIGDGLMVAATHVLLPLTSDDAPSAINKLNLYFAFGAVAGPIWAGAVLTTTGERWIVYAGVAAVAAAAFVLTLAADVAVHHPIAAPGAGSFRLPGHPTAWVMGAVLFLYVGAEFGLGSWVSSYAREAAEASVMTGALMSAGYWAALALGRVLSGLYFSGRREAKPPPARLGRARRRRRARARVLVRVHRDRQRRGFRRGARVRADLARDDGRCHRGRCRQPGDGRHGDDGQRRRARHPVAAGPHPRRRRAKPGRRRDRRAVRAHVRHRRRIPPAPRAHLSERRPSPIVSVAAARAAPLAQAFPVPIR